MAAGDVVGVSPADGGGASPRRRVTGMTLGEPQAVLAPASPSPCAARPSCAGSSSINCYGGLTSLADEHSSILPPGTLPGHASDYLFFVPTKTCLNGDHTAATGQTSGLVVLTGGSGPDGNDRWTLDYAPDYGAYDETIAGNRVQGIGQVFLSPMDRTSCPPASATAQDPTFDLNYANPSTVVVDPTTPDALLMVYEGTNRCINYDAAAAKQDNNFYSTIGVATSFDDGHAWPSYRAARTPLPEQGTTAGPDAPLGARGADVCLGNDCSATPPPNFGRYAAISAPTTVAQWMATGQALPAKSMGTSEPSAFVDDVAGNATPYLYTLANIGSGGFVYPGVQSGGVIGVARAQLGTGGPLAFTQWYGQDVQFGSAAGGSFAFTTIALTGADCGPGSTAASQCQISNAGLGSDGGGLGSPILPQDPGSSPASIATCQAGNQIQLGASLAYVDDTEEYLLLFICNSPVHPSRPAEAAPAGSARGAAWFFATLDATAGDLSRQDAWSPPREIPGSWAWLASNASDAGCPAGGCAACLYHGWYPTWMSLARRAGHLSQIGYVFSMEGCQDTSAGGPRTYLSRSFTLVLGGPI